MKLSNAIPIGMGLIGALILPLWAIILLLVFSFLCARESRRLRTGCQLTDWHWEHDMVSVRRTVLSYRPGSKVSFLRPRKFYGPR